MTQIVPPNYVEHLHQLALGVEPVDAMLGTRVSDRLTITLDGIPFPKPPWGNVPSLHWFEYPTSLSPLQRHSSCLHVLLKGNVKSPVSVRMYDRSRRFVPRRFKVDLGGGAVTSIAPRLFPGAAYDVSQTATGLRGTVKTKTLTDETPVRWTRVVATLQGSSTVVGRAFGDDRGEFILLLDSSALGVGALVNPLPIDVHVYAWSPAKVPVPAELASQDPLWDVPLEEPGLPPSASILAGEDIPPGFSEYLISDGVSVPAMPRTVNFIPGWLLTDEPTFYIS